MAQDISTQGTEFWVSFMGNGYKDHPDQGTWLRIQLLISAKEACSCTVANPRTGWERSFNIEANSTYLLDNIDDNQAYMEMGEYERVMDKGLIITSTDTVSVYCSNIAAYSFDVSYVMPIGGLADDYIIQTYDQSTDDVNYTSAFLIVATEDNTTVDIIPSNLSSQIAQRLERLARPERLAGHSQRLQENRGVQRQQPHPRPHFGHPRRRLYL